MTLPVLALRDCSAGYGGVEVLRSVQLELQPDEILAIVGMSGVGKTTLLHVLAGLLPATSGDVLFRGQPLGSGDPSIGVVFQDHSLFPWMTIAGNVELGLRIRGVPASERRRSTRRILMEVGIEECADSYPRDVSGGQRQRAALARTFVLDPSVVLLDEPFSSLDAITRERLQALTLSRLTDRATPAVIVTHDTEEAVYLGTRLAALGDGGGLRFLQNRSTGTDRTAPKFVATRRRLRRLLTESVHATDA